MRYFRSTVDRWRQWCIYGSVLLLLPLLLSGCSLFGRGEEANVTAEPTVNLVPTYTATPVPPPQAESPTVTPPPALVATATPINTPEPINAATIITPLIATVTQTPTAPVAAEPRLVISAAAANVRRGPGTEFDLMGSVNQGQSFPIVAKSPAGDWWQICCINEQPGWIFGELASVENVDAVVIAADIPTPAAVAEALPTEPAIGDVPTAPPPMETPAEVPAPTEVPAQAPAAPPDPSASSAGYFDPNAAYQIVHLKVLGLGENNGGIRDSTAQHLIFLTVLDQAGNGLDNVVVRNLVGDKSEVVTGSKGPGKAEITMYYEPFKLTVVSDPSGPTTSQVSNQMGLVFPHLPDLVGRLGDENYEYGACPTIDIKCEWPIQAIHFSYEITFQKVK